MACMTRRQVGVGWLLMMFYGCASNWSDDGLPGGAPGGCGMVAHDNLSLTESVSFSVHLVHFGRASNPSDDGMPDGTPDGCGRRSLMVISHQSTVLCAVAPCLLLPSPHPVHKCKKYHFVGCVMEMS
eukprot:scaffold35532_cov19-Tisochrysis_lutea.AAC.3